METNEEEQETNREEEEEKKMWVPAAEMARVAKRIWTKARPTWTEEDLEPLIG